MILGIFGIAGAQPTEIGAGEQPQLAVDPGGTVRLVYGQENRIFYSVSNDYGVSFSKPTLIAEISEMHLGMGRGPQLACSRDYSIVTAIDKTGNIHCFRMDHKTDKWSEQGTVNDIEGSAPEGLMGLAADEQNNFYAVWLDLRNDRKNKIGFSSMTGDGAWSKNKIVYKSPDGSVCQCCKPSVAVREKNVSLMFRNWLNGSRDLYVMVSSNRGSQFGNAAKLGNGTWKLNACPMDGGGILIDKNNNMHTVWQREGAVYYDQPGEAESRIAEGRSCGLFGDEAPFMTWQEGREIYGQPLHGARTIIGEGSFVNVVQLMDGWLATWEWQGKIVYKKF